MPTKFEKFIIVLLDNIFDFTTLIVAGALVIHYQITPPTQSDIPQIATWLLAVLGLMAVSGVWERNRRLARIEKVGKETKELVKQYADESIPASKFFTQQKLHQIPEKNLLLYQSFDISGMILGRTVREYMGVFQEKIHAGGSIRILICDASNIEVINQIALRVEGNFSPNYWKERLEGTEMYIREIAKTPHKRGAIKLGFLPYLPAFGQINIDSQKSHGVCYVEVYQHKSPDSGPIFEVHKAKDTLWHQFFIKQYELLWESCRIETL